MAANTLSLPRPNVQPLYMDSPGTLFLNRKSTFTPKESVLCHYRLDVGQNTVQSNRRSTVNVTFNPIKTNSDPYVNASNWLPKFKDLCKGFLARKKAIEKRKKHEAAGIIQRAASLYLDPWNQLFKAIRPTLKIIKMDELKKYLRQCIIQIKKLNSERFFVENQLGDVETLMEHLLQASHQTGQYKSERVSPNMFTTLSDEVLTSNNGNFFKECLDIDLKDIMEVEVTFDPMSCQDSKVHVVYDLADKVQQKILEDNHRVESLLEKCRNLEKEVADLRSTNTSLETNTRVLRGLIAKHDINTQDHIAKAQDYVSVIEKMTQEKKAFRDKIKECEKTIGTKDEDLVRVNGKCEYYESELENKARLMEALHQEKLRQEKKIKELEDKLQFNLENQNELESTISIQKARYVDLKKRLTEQVKTTEEELAATISTSKLQLGEQNELIETQEEKIKQHEETIRKLETQIGDKLAHVCDDDEVDYEQERRLKQKLKNSDEANERMREDIRTMETSNTELRIRVIELQTNLEKAEEETTEYKISTERLKAQIETSKCALNDTELKLNRANREKNFHSTKLSQARDKIRELEAEVTKLQEDMKHSSQTVTMRNREFEAMNSDFSETKRGLESKIRSHEDTIAELHRKIEENMAGALHNSEKWKEDRQALEEKIEELQLRVEEKQTEIEEYNNERQDQQKAVKRLQRKLEEQKDALADNDKTISKLRDQLQTLQEENETQWSTLTSTGLTSPMEKRLHDLQSIDRSLSRASSNASTLPTPSITRSPAYSSMQHNKSLRH